MNAHRLAVELNLVPDEDMMVPFFFAFLQRDWSDQFHIVVVDRYCIWFLWQQNGRIKQT